MGAATWKNPGRDRPVHCGWVAVVGEVSLEGQLSHLDRSSCSGHKSLSQRLCLLSFHTLPSPGRGLTVVQVLRVL